MAKPTITEAFPALAGHAVGGYVRLVASVGGDAAGYATASGVSVAGILPVKLDSQGNVRLDDGTSGGAPLVLNPNSGASVDVINSPTGTAWELTITPPKSRPVKRYLAVPDATGPYRVDQILTTAPAAMYSQSSFDRVVNLLAFGAVNTGLTDAAPTIQALVNASPAGTMLYAPEGTYLLRSGIKWKSGISLVGDGPGRTILKPYNAGPLASGFSAIYNFTDGGIGSELTSCIFRDFEIDGIGITTTSYDVGSKGINILYMKRARFENLYIHDCHASGLGSDQMLDSVITGCVLEGNGRQNDGTQLGGAGIGIGSGKYTTMGLVIEGCVARGNGTHGIFIEHQPGTSTRSFGVRIAGCLVETNRYGISDWGADGLIVSGCTFNANTVYGFGSTAQGTGHFVGVNGIVQGCTFTAHSASGANAIRIGDACTRYVVKDNLIKLGGTGPAIQIADVFQSGSTSQEITIDGNEIVATNGPGIRVDNVVNDLAITRNRVRNSGKSTGLATDLRSGISINAAVDRAAITDNRCWDNQGTKTQTYGIYITASGVVTNATMTGNVLDGNLTGAWGYASGATSPPVAERDATSWGHTFSMVNSTASAIRQDGAGSASTGGTLAVQAGSATRPLGLRMSTAATIAATANLQIGNLAVRRGAAGDMFGGFSAHARGVVALDASYDNTGASTGSRLWPLALFGTSAATVLGADRGGTQNLVGFVRANVNGGATDTTWQLVTCDNTTTNVVDTGVAFTIGSVYDFHIDCALGGTSIAWTIDNRTTGQTRTGSTSTNLPLATNGLSTMVGVQTVDAVARSIDWSTVYVSSAVG